jgi:CRP-like cAMP-binding protein
MSIEQILSNIEASFIPLTDECKEDLKKVSVIMTLEKETPLVKEGQFANKLYFIATGSVRAYYFKDQKDITDWFAFENNFINSINSFFLNIPSPHFIEVIEPSLLLEISREDFMFLSEKHQSLFRLGNAIVTKTMLQLQKRIVSIQFETAQQKYENLLKIRPDISQRVPLTHIASFLGITLETLSRIRNPKYRI